MTSPNSIPTQVRDRLNHSVNDLFDACALLDAAADRIDSATPSADENEVRHESMHNTLRIVQMAKERVKAAAESLFEID